MIMITYEVCSIHCDEPIEFTGIFESTNTFKRFAEREVARPCYRKVRFKVLEQRVLPEEEYARFCEALCGKGEKTC